MCFKNLNMCPTNSFNTDKMKIKQSLNVNDEYLCVVRTKSFADFFIKAQLLVNNDPSSSSSSSSSSSAPARRHSAAGVSELLLNPAQETIESILESSLFSNKSSHLKPLLSNYFNISAEASDLCSHLLRGLIQLQSNHRFIHKIIDAIDLDHDSSHHLMISELRARVDHPFSDLNRQDFKHIQQTHSSVLQQLKSKRKRVARKIKMIKFFNRASGVCVAAACGVAAAATVFLAMHTLTALMMGPALLGLPVKPLKRKMRSFRFVKYGLLREDAEQLDVAAKGAYILNRDFDTIGRLVGRIQDEIEHNRAMMEVCLERGEDKHCLQMLKEMNKYEFGVRKQAEELEEHVYLCLVTINRARAMVVREICKTCTQNSVH